MIPRLKSSSFIFTLSFLFLGYGKTYLTFFQRQDIFSETSNLLPNVNPTNVYNKYFADNNIEHIRKKNQWIIFGLCGALPYSIKLIVRVLQTV